MKVISSYLLSRTAPNLTEPLTLSGGLTQTRGFHPQNTRIEFYLLHKEIACKTVRMVEGKFWFVIGEIQLNV
jgi:hypothetical protein